MINTILSIYLFLHIADSDRHLDLSKVRNDVEIGYLSNSPDYLSIIADRSIESRKNNNIHDIYEERTHMIIATKLFQNIEHKSSIISDS